MFPKLNIYQTTEKRVVERPTDRNNKNKPNPECRLDSVETRPTPVTSAARLWLMSVQTPAHRSGAKPLGSNDCPDHVFAHISS